MDDPEQLLIVGNGQGRAAGARDAIDRLVELRRRGLLRQARLREDRVDGALAQNAARQIDAGNAGLRGERDDSPLRAVGGRIEAVAALR
jgi:hypothetical protein